MKTYLATFNPKKNKGVFAISLVENPAMEGYFVALKEDKEIKLAEVDKEQRILMGLVLEPNKDVYRNQDGNEFFLRFNEETIKELSHNFFRLGNQSNSTIEHVNSNKINGVTFVESWIVENPEIDKSTNFGFSYPKGSWVATMKIDNDDVWNDYVKTGKVKGFSVDAMLSLEEVKLSKNETTDGTQIWFEDIMLKRGDLVTDLDGNKLKDGAHVLLTNVEIDVKDGLVLDIKEVNLKSIITMSKEKEKSIIELLMDLPNQIKIALKGETKIELGSVKLADGSLTIEFDGDALNVGAPIWAVAEDGTKVPIPVGEHKIEDGSTLVVVEEGVVSEIRTMENSEADMASPDGKVNTDAEIAKEIETAIKSILIKYSEQDKRISDLEKVNIELSNQLEEIGKEPASKGIKQPEVRVDLSKMSSKQRIQHIINQAKN